MSDTLAALVKQPAKIHTLKTWPVFFRAIVEGRKRHEIRRNDRDFQVGDCLVLQEYDPKTDTFTREMFSARVTYLSDAFMPEGFVAMSIEPWEEALAAIVAPHQLPELTNQLIGTLHGMTREQLLDWLAELYEAQGLLGVDRLAPHPQKQELK